MPATIAPPAQQPIPAWAVPQQPCQRRAKTDPFLLLGFLGVSLQAASTNRIRDRNSLFWLDARGCRRGAEACRVTIEAGYVLDMARILLQRLHNPRGRECGCDPECWCRRTALGRAVRWWFPGRYFGLHHKSQGSADWKQAYDPTRP